MPLIVRVIRNVTPEECPWLERTVLRSTYWYVEKDHGPQRALWLVANNCDGDEAFELPSDALAIQSLEGVAL